MVDGYRKVYHDRSHLTIACTLGWGLYLLKDNNDNKKRIR